MRMRTFFTSLALIVLTTSLGLSQYSARESFEYPTGDSLAAATGQAKNGWADSWTYDNGTSGLMAMGTVDLPYGDLNYPITNIGNHVTVSNPGGWVAARYTRHLDKVWPDEAGKVYWTSFIFEAKGVPTGNTYYCLKLFSGSGEVMAIGKSGGGTLYSCGSGWAGGAGDDVSTVTCEGGPVWLVTKTVMSGDANNDRTYMWINPDPSGAEPDTNVADVKRWTAMSSGFDNVRLECGGADSMQTNWDELRLGTSWSDVSSKLSSGVNFTLEEFNYANGTVLDETVGTAGNGWAGSWGWLEGTKGSVVVADTGFTYGDLSYPVPNSGLHLTGVNSGGAWQYQRWGRYLSEPSTDASGNVYWLSFLMEMRGSWNANSWAGVGLYDSTKEGPLFGKGWGATVYSIGSSADQGRTTTSWDSGPMWAVVKVFMSGDTLEEKLYMWLNLDPKGAEPDTALADAKYIQKMNNGFNRIVYHFGGEFPDEILSVDEIRLAKKWVDVSSPYTSIREVESVPTKYNLSQNYPNPFNPTTRISYNLETVSDVRLTVYDMLGKEVARLATGLQNAGPHTVEFNATNLTSGVYFYQLQTGNTIATKKMLLLK